MAAVVLLPQPSPPAPPGLVNELMWCPPPPPFHTAAPCRRAGRGRAETGVKQKCADKKKKQSGALRESKGEAVVYAGARGRSVQLPSGGGVARRGVAGGSGAWRGVARGSGALGGPGWWWGAGRSEELGPGVRPEWLAPLPSRAPGHTLPQHSRARLAAYPPGAALAQPNHRDRFSNP